MQQMVIYW